ncbi:MAG TPA: C25 family cysteine peptidase [Blastocatellia bacterium]|nr:C25 family cysteine peptidase [Blastocatellia bacterium]
MRSTKRLKRTRPALIVITLAFFVLALSLSPNTVLKTSAARAIKASNPPSKNVPAARASALPQGQKSAGEPQELDPDLPPMAYGVIDKEAYLLKRNENINFLRGIPYPADRPNPRIKAIEEMLRAREINAPLINSGTWTEIGPAPLPNGQTEGVQTPVSGRTIAIAVHPTNPNIAYVGTAQGGVYRTTDGGDSWKAIFDSAQSLAAGSIFIAPSQTTTVYVGTGEPGGSCDSFFGVGLYKITNAESATPTLNGPLNPGGIFTGRAIGDVVVHPTNPDIIFVSTASGIGGLNCEAFGGGTVPPLPGRGLFRSTDGGASFTKMTTATGTNILVGNFPHNEIVIDPANPNRVAVGVNAPISPAGGGTGGGIYVSTDALAATPTFTRTLSLESVRIELDLHSSGGTVNIYAASGESNGRLRRSTDGGATWSGILTAANGFCGGQCFYDIALAIDPTNPNIVMLGGNVTGAATKLIARSTDGGATFTNVATGVHADNHVVTFAPSNNQVGYMGTDGGIYKTTNNGTSWTSRSIAGYNATQFMSIAVHPSDFFFTIGGTQDNGTEWLRPDNTWTRADFGDGGFALIDQNAANTTTVTMYHTYFNQSNAKGYARVLTTVNATDNGWSFFGCGFAGSIPNGMVCSGPTLFYAPMTLGPGNPNTLYFGADRLYRSIDSGTTVSTVSQLFAVAISAVGIAPTNDNVRIVGLTNGTVFATATGANPLVQQTGTPAFPARGVGRIAVDPTNPNVAYVGFTGFGVTANQHIYKTTNLNAVTPTWTPAGSGIPDVPVNALAIDPLNSNVVFAGTDIGVFKSQDGGANWFPFGSGLPVIAVFGMEIQNANRFLRIATHGRGMWEISLQPTAIKLEEVAATGYDQGQFIEWNTGHEVNNLGFNVYRQEGGKRTRLNQQLLAGSALVAGQSNALTAGKKYGFWDGATASKQAVEYWLEEIDLDGQSTFHGPIVAKAVGGAPPEKSQAQLLSQIGVSQSTATRPVTRSASLPAPQSGQARAIAISTDLSGQAAVKLAVRSEGWYRVSQADLLAAGISPGVNPRMLQLFVDGAQAPIKVIGELDNRLDPSDSVEFYGLGLDASWTDARVYWLAVGSQPGLRVQTSAGAAGQNGAASFPYTVERRDRSVYFSALRNGDRENFFGAVVTNTAVDQSITLSGVSPSATQNADLEVALQGVSRTAHNVSVIWNGTALGSIEFRETGYGVGRFSVPHSSLREGANLVQLAGTAGQNDVTLVDFINVTYQRLYKAENNALKFTAQANQQVSVTGFTSGDVRVVDVTDPAGPIEVAGAVKQQNDGSYTLTASAAGSGARTLMAFAAGQARTPAGVAANQPSAWSKPSNGADLLIITRKELFASLNPLKLHRQSQGLSVAAIDIEDLFDERSYGHKSPQAVKDFLAIARSTWKRAPRYVLFVGDASFDPKNYLGFGDNDLVVTRTVDTQSMEAFSDEWFVDSNGDGVGEMAVGRLPVRNAQEAAAVAAKLINYDRSSPSEEMLLVADSTEGFNFRAASFRLRELVPANLRVGEVNRDVLGDSTARSELIEAINRGQKVVNYTGHGSLELWRGNLLSSADAASLANRDRLSIFIMMTCLNGYFTDPVVEPLAEALLKSSGGAVAVWASTGMTDPGGQASMNQEMYRQMFASGTRLGDAALGAKSQVKDYDLRRTWVLFGDPTTRIR